MHLPGPEGAHRRLWGDFLEREAVMGWKEWLRTGRGRHLCTFQDPKRLLRERWVMIWKRRIGEGGIYASSRT